MVSWCMQVNQGDVMKDKSTRWETDVVGDQ